MNCPECGSDNIRTSRSTRWNDIFQRVRGRDVFRCRKCRLRFYASVSAGAGLKHSGKSDRAHSPQKLISTRKKRRLVKRLIVVSIFVFAFIVFLAFLRYITAEKETPSDPGAVSFLVLFSSTYPA